MASDVRMWPRLELRHAGPSSVNREGELERPSRVACSDLLNPSFPSTNRPFGDTQHDESDNLRDENISCRECDNPRTSEMSICSCGSLTHSNPVRHSPCPLDDQHSASVSARGWLGLAGKPKESYRTTLALPLRTTFGKLDAKQTVEEHLHDHTRRNGQNQRS